MPYRAASGLEYDSGDFAAVLDAGLERADWAGFAARRDASAAKGRLRGRGLACYLEVTAPPSPEMGGIRFEPDGRVTIVTGTLDYGQGHASAFAQVLVERLGVPFELIDLVQGDSDELLVGGGTGGSRSIMASGKALVEAAAAVIEKGRTLAGHFLEAAAADIDFAAGRFRIAGTDRSIALLDLAARAREATELPPDLPDSLDAALISESPPSAFPNGCHVAEVEIDPETGQVRLDRYTALDDFGTLVNPLLAEGQVHGGVAQGIGQALLERAVYDPQGQLLTGSFMDYALPRADTVPERRGRLPSGTGDQQPARRQGLRRGRRDRRIACGDERRARCPGEPRRARARHAGDARACVAGLAGRCAGPDPQRRCVRPARHARGCDAPLARSAARLASTARRRPRRNCHLTRIERLVNVRPGTARALVEWRDDRLTSAGPTRNSARRRGTVSDCGYPRRTLLRGAIGLGLTLPLAPVHAAQEDDPKKARPQAGDQFVYFSGDRKGKVVKPDDLPLGGPQILAYPKDPATDTVRNGSRLNQVLLIRLDPAQLSKDTSANAAEGVVAYSAACTHEACPVSMWRKEKGGCSIAPAMAPSTTPEMPQTWSADRRRGGWRCCRSRARTASWSRPVRSRARSAQPNGSELGRPS